MFNGQNASGKEFDVIDEDGDILGSFEFHADAVACGRAAPWYAGECNIRRDLSRTPTGPRLPQWWLVEPVI